MQKLILTTCMSALTFFGFTQKAAIDLPINWDDTANVNYTVTDFGNNSSMLAADPVNASNLCLKSDKLANAQTWAGTTLSTNTGLAMPIAFAPGSTIIKAVVYSPDTGIVVKLKAEDALDPTKSVETDVNTTVANAWDTLTFDFSNHSPGTAPINFAITFNKLSIFYNFGVDGMTAGLKTYYLDSIWFTGSPAPSKMKMNFPITWDDTANVDYSTTDFGGNTSMQAVDPMNATNLVLMSTKDSTAQSWAGTTFGTGQGLDMAIPFASGATIIKAVVYSPDSGIVVKLKAEDKTSPTTSVETDAVTMVANAWDTLTFDFSNQSPGTAAINFSNTYDKLSIFYNFGVLGQTAGIKTYYVDAVMFMGGGSGGGQSKQAIELPITWDDTANVDYTVADFGGNVSTHTSDPMNANNLVLQSVKDTSAQSWAGTTLSTASGLGKAIAFKPGHTTIKAVVYSPDTGIAVRLKAEDAASPTLSVETEAMVKLSGGWDTLSFDFTNHVAGTSPINFSTTYDKLSIFYNFGVDGKTAGNKTYYVDFIELDTMGGTPPPPAKAQIDLPITWDDTANVDYSVTDFGGNSSSHVVDPMNSSNLVIQSVKDTSAESWAGTTLSTPMGLKNPIPFKSDSTVIKVLVYSPDAGIPVRLKVEDHTDPTISVETEVNTTTANAWDTLSFDFNKPVSGTPLLDTSKTYDKISIFYNFGTTGKAAGNKTYYADDVFFGGAGAVPPPIPDTFNITFRLDMSEHTGTFTTPEVNGIFNGWCGNCNAMSKDTATGMWEVTLAIVEGETEYKFSNDNWAGQEDLDTSLSCTKTTGTFTNRVLTVTKDTTLTAVCWESCEKCTTTGVENLVGSKNLKLFPNPTTSIVNIVGSAQGDEITVMDMRGRVVHTSISAGENHVIDLQEQKSGIYLVRIQSNSETTVLRMVKE